MRSLLRFNQSNVVFMTISKLQSPRGLLSAPQGAQFFEALHAEGFDLGHRDRKMQTVGPADRHALHPHSKR